MYGGETLYNIKWSGDVSLSHNMFIAMNMPLNDALHAWKVLNDYGFDNVVITPKTYPQQSI